MINPLLPRKNTMFLVNILHRFRSYPPWAHSKIRTAAYISWRAHYCLGHACWCRVYSGSSSDRANSCCHLDDYPETDSCSRCGSIGRVVAYDDSSCRRRPASRHSDLYYLDRWDWRADWAACPGWAFVSWCRSLWEKWGSSRWWWTSLLTSLSCFSKGVFLPICEIESLSLQNSQ